MFFKHASIHLIFLPPSTRSLVHSFPRSFVHICIELEVRCNLLCFLIVPNNFIQKEKDYRGIPRNLPLIPSSLLWSQVREQLAAEGTLVPLGLIFVQQAFTQKNQKMSLLTQDLILIHILQGYFGMNKLEFYFIYVDTLEIPAIIQFSCTPF